MYCPLIHRFRGALIGGVVAESHEILGNADTALLPMAQALIHEGERFSTLASYIDQFGHREHSRDAATRHVAQIVLISLMLHDDKLERLHTIQKGQASIGERLLSDVLTLGLCRQPTNFRALLLDTAILDSSDAHPLLATLEGLVTQKVTLQPAMEAIAAFPNLSVLDQTIAVSCYCWLCTPQQFNICVARSRHALRYLPHHNFPLVPAVTGMIAGAFGGCERILNLNHSLAQNVATLVSVANQLFQNWAGMDPNHPNSSALEQSVITQQGDLKPRKISVL